MEPILDHRPTTLEVLAARCGRSKNAVKQHLRHLMAQGLAERVARGVYRASDRGLRAQDAGLWLRKGPKGPHTGFQRPRRETVVDLSWKLLRLLGRASAAEIAALLPVEPGRCGGRAPEANVRRYLKVLERFGYVRRLPRERRGPGWAGRDRFALVRDTGPLAPIWRPSRGALCDPNLDRDIRPEPLP